LPGAGEIHRNFLSLPPLVRMAHDAWAVAFALLGSILACRLEKWAADELPGSANAVVVGEMPGWWRAPAWVGLLSIGLVAAAALAGWRWDPDIAAGTAFLLAWILVGLAAIGAVFDKGRRRAAWLGATSLGLGYLVLAFAPVASDVLPTNHLLKALVRPSDAAAGARLPEDDLTADEESQRVRTALEVPVSLHFPENTPLKVVLAPIKKAVRNALGKELVIYTPAYELRLSPEAFDGLLVSIVRENIPARDALRLCLDPLGLTYRVQSGYIRVYVDAYQPIPFKDDPVMIAGHSLIAVIVAAFGGVAGPIVASQCRRQQPSG